MDIPNSLGVSKFDCLKFFFVTLRDRTRRVRPTQEALHSASILAHYSISSTADTGTLPAPRDLVDVFDMFVHPPGLPFESRFLLEGAGAQSLLLTGFFRNQMRRRHSVRWYEQLGSSFYKRASRLTDDPDTYKVLVGMSEHFSYWAGVFHGLSKDLRDERYIIRLD